MSTISIVVVASLMALMGVCGIITPVRFLRFVGSETLGRDGRNEVRAVYGGFGLMMGGILLYAVQETAYQPGILLCMGLALAGMAIGRIISIVPDRGISAFMVFTCISEFVAGGVLLLAI